MVVNEDKIDDVKKYTTFAGHFDGHGNATVQWGVHRLMEQIHGYTRCHWMPPSGKKFAPYSPGGRHGINFGSKIQVVVLWNR